MKRTKFFFLSALGLIALALLFSSCKDKESPGIASAESGYRDLYSDTWVASDALGRKMPSFEEAGPVKNDQRRIAGIFYLTWHIRIE